VLQEARYAVRTLRKNPGFTLVAVLSLALGIGANSTIFSLADALLFRPLPVARPGEIVSIRGQTPGNRFVQLSYPEYRDVRDHNRSFNGLVAFTLGTYGFAEGPNDLPQIRAGLMVSGDFFRVLGVEPQLGRGFRPEEDQATGRGAVVVLGRDFWEKHYAGNASVLGRRVRLNGVEFTIIGVAREGFTGMDQFFRPAFFIPFAMWPRLAVNPKENPLERRDLRWLSVKGRLKAGVSLDQAQAELAGIARGMAQAHPQTNRDFSMLVRTEMQIRIDRSPPDATLVGMLLGLVGLVLLIACANVANLILSRGQARSREIAVRLAIGAGRGRLLRQLLIESLLLCLAGAAAGLVVAYGGVKFLSRIQIPTDLPLVLAIQLDRRVLLYSLCAAVVSALVAGLVPAIRSTRSDLVEALKEGDRSSSGPRRLLGRGALVAGQVALTMALLIAAATLYRGFRNLLLASPGFRTDHILMMSFDPTLVRYTVPQAQDYFLRLVERAKTVPGVKSAALTQVIPFGPNQDREEISPEGYQFPRGQDSVTVWSNAVDEGYFDTFQVRILAGRAFRATDIASAPRVAIVNQALASTYWPDQDPVGKRFRLGGPQGEWVQIVGVAETGKYLFIAEAPTGFLFLPLRQNPRERMTLLTESYGASASLAAPLREGLRSLDANQPVFDVRTIDSFYQMRAVSTPGLIIQIVAIAGLMGLVLALVGLYGVVAYSVSRRTREIGIRMAVGAARPDVLWMVLRQGLRLTVFGLCLGFLISLGVGRVLRAGFQVDAVDPVAFVVVPVGLLAATVLATLVPARPAARVNPTSALRFE